MVVVIIGVLVALLLPVVGGAMRTARNATVTGEFSTISQSIASFRNKYGEDPPSRIMLCEDGFWDVQSPTETALTANPKDITREELARRSVQFLRKFWPRVPISTTVPLFDGSGSWYDFNGNGVFDGTGNGTGVILTGDECLVFFLGGIPQATGTTGDPGIAVAGFAKGSILYPPVAGSSPGTLPQPFRNNLNNGVTTNRAYGPDREPSTFEFKADRLRDLDGDGFPSYMDALNNDKPYVYFKAYTGHGGYDPNDVNFAEADDANSAITAVARNFYTTHIVGQPAAPTRVTMSPAPNPYTSGLAFDSTRGAISYHKDTSFQLISAGGDGLFGPGGQYAPNANQKLPLEPGTTAVPNLNTTDADIRSRERDNLANFASGKLD